MISTTVDESGTRRAVTKLVEGERLVSCTCCVSEACCLYDANTLYETEFLQYEDLPETWNEGEFTKLDPPLTAPQIGDNPNGWYDGFTAYYTDPNFVFGNMGYIGIYDSTNTQWSTAIDFAPVSLGTCLNDFLTDDFFDEYALDDGLVQITVTRTGPCLWAGSTNSYGGIAGNFASGEIVFHDNIAGDPNEIQRFEATMEYDLPNFGYQKNPFGGLKDNNDTPEGVYGTGGDVITVTEA